MINNYLGDSVINPVNALGDTLTSAYNHLGDLIYSGSSDQDYSSYTITHLFSIGSGCQDMGYYNGKIYQFTSSGSFTVYNMDGSVSSSGSGSVGHNNSTIFNLREFPTNYNIPYLFSTDTVYPVRIYKNRISPTTCIVSDTFSVPDGNGYCGSFCFDFKNGIGYFIAHSTNSAASPETIISIWDFNSITMIDNIGYPSFISSVTVTAIGVIQGAEFRNGKVFVAIGGTGQIPRLVILNPTTGVIEHTITVSDQTIEAEGLAFIDDFNILFVLQNRDYYKITFDEMQP